MIKGALLVISHTLHYRNSTGNAMGWPATVREIDELASVFDKVIHVACLSDVKPPVESASYLNPKVEFVPIPTLSGQGDGHEMASDFTYSSYLRRIWC